MAKSIANLKKELRARADNNKAVQLQRFFKTGRGEYGEGDQFLGVMVPQQRALVKKYYAILDLADCEKLLSSPWHEERLTALLVLVAKFARADEKTRALIFRFYLTHTARINNWDLVDLSAPRIVGSWLYKKDKTPIFRLARSKTLWENRIAILAVFYDIGQGEFSCAMRLAEMFANDRRDLIQKAVGWMLREVHKRGGAQIVEDFLQAHRQTMPRTMLRYAIERMSQEKRGHYLGRG